jgi:hypothetical protein
VQRHAAAALSVVAHHKVCSVIAASLQPCCNDPAAMLQSIIFPSNQCMNEFRWGFRVVAGGGIGRLMPILYAKDNPFFQQIRVTRELTEPTNSNSLTEGFTESFSKFLKGITAAIGLIR